MTALPPGTQLSHYRILSKLGEGGMGVVYRAVDLKLERDVALKILRQDLASDPDRFARFQREARALAVLNHPNVGAIYQIDEADGQAFIVMEYIEGQTLRQRIAGRPLPVDLLLDFALQITDALAAAHGKGIVHRDIKPPNLLVNERGQIKMLDFGLAKLAAGDDSGDGSSRLETAHDQRQLTTPGATMGTIAYMSPEQVRGEEVDSRSDLFSFGAVLYEMATGRCAFQAATSGLTFDAILNRAPTPPEQVNPDVPYRLVEIIHRALEKDRRLRYQSAADMHAELSRVRRDADSSGRVPARPPQSEPPRGSGAFRAPRRRAGWKEWTVAALVVSAAAGTAAYVLTRGGAATASINAIAVLPFEYAGRQPDGEYLSDGITEQLINGLSKVPSLRVIPRSMIFSYKGQRLDPRRVGRDLGVGGVVTGRVTQREDNLTITAELIDVQSVSQVWGQQWTRSSSQVFEVSEEIARELSRALQLRLTPDAEERLVRRYTDNPDAYAKYVKSLSRVQRGTRSEFEEAIAAAEEAIVEDMKQRAVQIPILPGRPGREAPGRGAAGAAPGQDPGFALAYSSLARLYTRQAYFDYLPANVAHPKARAAAEWALQMDQSLAAAQGALAFVSFFYEWDWQGAERRFREALRLAPDDDETRKDHAWYLMAMGKTQEALHEMEKARALNPQSEPLAAQLAEMIFWAGRDEQALKQADAARDLDPESPGAMLVTAYVQSRRGLHADAIASYLDYLALADKESVTSPTLAWFYARAGRPEEAMALVKRAAPGEISPAQMAWISSALGDHDSAFAWLEKALVQRASGLIWIRTLPWFDPLRSDPRLKSLLARMGLDGP